MRTTANSVRLSGVQLNRFAMHWLSGFTLMAMVGPLGAQSTAQPPVLLAFSLGDSVHRAHAGQSLPLHHRVVGTAPSHYRVSTRADFAGAPWLPYTPPLRWDARPVGALPCPARTNGSLVRVHLQVRAVLGQDVRVIDGQRSLVPVTVESNVLADSTCVAS